MTVSTIWSPARRVKWQFWVARPIFGSHLPTGRNKWQVTLLTCFHCQDRAECLRRYHPWHSLNQACSCQVVYECLGRDLQYRLHRRVRWCCRPDLCMSVSAVFASHSHRRDCDVTVSDIRPLLRHELRFTRAFRSVALT